jgi:cellulose synthase (UDP-forming)
VIQWPILRPLIILLALNVVGMLFSALTDVVFERDPGDGRSIILFWSLYNVVVLGASMAVCIETPRSRTSPQITPESVGLLVSGRTTRGWLMRLTVEDAWVRGGPRTQPGDEVVVEIDAVGAVPASVTRIELSGFALALRPSHEQRAAILRRLHTRIRAPGTQRTHLASVVTGAFRRLTRN